MQYTCHENIATITMDDGKANAVGLTFLDDINANLHRAQEEDVAALILRGRTGMFSGGFDLREFEKGHKEGMIMVTRGFELLLRLYSFPIPVVAACTGHAVALGAFIIMACDTRIGTRGEYKITLPETAISMGLPPLLLALAESCLSRNHMTRAAIQSEIYSPDNAIEAGFLDEVVDAEQLQHRAVEVAKILAKLPKAQYATNKLSVRDRTLTLMKDDLVHIKQQ